MQPSWHGVFPAAITHFRADESLDLPPRCGTSTPCSQAGIHGLIMLGTVGENCSLEYGEKLDVLKRDGRARAPAACRC